MDTITQKFLNTINHISALHDVFKDEEHFDDSNLLDFQIYQENLRSLGENLSNLKYSELLYQRDNRQMILADFFEYVFFGRVYYSMKTKEDKKFFITAILNFVNLLMCFESLTVSDDLRKSFLNKLTNTIPEIKEEEFYVSLHDFSGSVGLPNDESDADANLNDYFDSLLPKTAGGLWHELLVYIFMLRNDVGYIIPLLLSQKLFGLSDHIVPPDFLILSYEKRLYGIEVGGFKERQSSNFVLRTAIPTASVDTRNARTDRCPICKKWINFCPFVIEMYSDLKIQIDKAQLKCIEECTHFEEVAIAGGACPYTKYQRGKAKTFIHTHHDYSDSKHYHYQCVLNSVDKKKRDQIINAKDNTALKTHYPYYSGLEGLFFPKN